MFFKRKESFFLDLGNEAGQSAAAGQAAPAPAPVQVAVREPASAASAAPVAAPATARTEAKTEARADVKAGSAAAAAAAPAKPMLTTAEAIAAELRAAQEARPAPSSATFAPDCLNPANAIASRRRTAGANLAGFKAMAADLFKS
ncbi:MAG: hypothetical protein ACKO50_11575 [Cyanobium sp.]